MIGSQTGVSFQWTASAASVSVLQYCFHAQCLAHPRAPPQKKNFLAKFRFSQQTLKPPLNRNISHSSSVLTCYHHPHRHLSPGARPARRVSPCAVGPPMSPRCCGSSTRRSPSTGRRRNPRLRWRPRRHGHSHGLPGAPKSSVSADDCCWSEKRWLLVFGGMTGNSHRILMDAWRMCDALWPRFVASSALDSPVRPVYL